MSFKSNRRGIQGVRRMMDLVGQGQNAEIQETTLQPSSATGIDSMILEVGPDNNYGTTVTLDVGTGNALNKRKRSLIAFDLSSIPAGSTILAATLSLYCESETNTTDRVADIYRALTQWYEGGQDGADPHNTDASTWNERNANTDSPLAWGAAGGQSGTDYAAVATDSTTITGPNAWFDWDVTVDVAAFMIGNNYGWWLLTDESVINTTKKFTASDGVTAANRPKLWIQYQ